MHLRHAFHGRSGYTLSLTNTDPVKIDRFPKFDWPRISSPALRFPLLDHAEENRRSEDEAIAQAVSSFAANPHRIACFVVEPIQAEGGDRHLSARFLGAMQELCIENEALFVLDEVQTGVGVDRDRGGRTSRCRSSLMSSRSPRRFSSEASWPEGVSTRSRTTSSKSPDASAPPGAVGSSTWCVPRGSFR